MMSPRQVIMRGVLAGVLVASVGVGALLGYVRWYTAGDRILPGVKVGDLPVGGLSAGEATRRLAEAGIAGPGTRTETLPAVGQAAAFGRQGPIWRQARLFLSGLVHGHMVPLARSLPQVQSYVQAGPPVIPQAFGSSVPLDQRRAAGTVQHLISRFTTPILAAAPGRVQNIALGIAKVNGTTVAPGKVFSFNERVGPRDADHGWAQATEIYQGDYVIGYGGGICQVSSTLYNAVLLGGLEVTLRHHHDRPLQYVSPGRDATVAWNLLDFQFRNDSGVPVTIGAQILAGSPQQIEVALYAPRPLPAGSVLLEEGERKYEPPVLEEIPDPSLPAGARRVLDEGRSGIEVKIYRVIRESDGSRRELVSHDHYRAKPGRVQVGVGNGPGSQRLLNPGIR